MQILDEQGAGSTANGKPKSPTLIRFISSLVHRARQDEDGSVRDLTLKKICEWLFMHYGNVLIGLRKLRIRSADAATTEDDSPNSYDAHVVVDDSLLAGVASAFESSLHKIVILPKTDLYVRVFRETCGIVAGASAASDEGMSNEDSFDFLSAVAAHGAVRNDPTRATQNNKESKKDYTPQICQSCGQVRKGHSCPRGDIVMLHTTVGTDESNSDNAEVNEEEKFLTPRPCEGTTVIDTILNCMESYKEVIKIPGHYDEEATDRMSKEGHRCARAQQASQNSNRPGKRSRTDKPPSKESEMPEGCPLQVTKTAKV